MAQEYQPRRFFRHAPNRLLERYFAARNSGLVMGALRLATRPLTSAENSHR
jgi:hypothetical protein